MQFWHHIRPDYFLNSLPFVEVVLSIDQENYRGHFHPYVRDNIHHIPKTTHHLVKNQCLGRQVDDF